MIRYPIPFETAVHARSGINEVWQTSSGGRQIDCAVPPEFSGPGGGFSPEDLFAQALANCFVGTFKVIAENSRLTYGRLTAQGRLSVDLDESKRPCMRDFHLAIRLSAPSDPEKAVRLVKKAMDSGFILNSVRTHISYDLAVD